MSTLSQVMKQLHAERKKVHGELSRLDAAIRALQGLSATNGSGTIQVVSSKPRRTLSAAARRKIAAAQRARWAAWKAKQKKAA